MSARNAFASSGLRGGRGPFHFFCNFCPIKFTDFHRLIDYFYIKKEAIKSATIFRIFIMGLIAGPAVSL